MILKRALEAFCISMNITEYLDLNLGVDDFSSRKYYRRNRSSLRNVLIVNERPGYLIHPVILSYS